MGFFRNYLPFRRDRKSTRLNSSHQIISQDGAPVIVMVVPTNEELMIAQDTMELVLDQE